ncbi:MAG TPA: hypothetical protein VG148_10290 [Pyrinomonadaceae bacterium]|nr:hypothetical protein [Pyrinomonadaceae bacterium]
MRHKVRPPGVLIPLSVSLLALVSYLPTLGQPLIEDDYPNIALAREHGPVGGWAGMARDRVNRVRATTFVVTHWVERAFGLRPAAFYSLSILLHVSNCLLIYALGRWPPVGFRVSGWAAAFFAVHEGHQEAVMWYSACNELLLFFFGSLSLLGWLLFLEGGRGRRLWYAASLLSFVLALLSKESSVVLVAVLSLPLLLGPEPRARRLPALSPFAVLAAVYAVSIFQTRGESFRFSDGSFDLGAPFWETWAKSFFALFWPWGWLAAMTLAAGRRFGGLLRLGVFWVSVSFVPYMFVAYVHRVPSRQTYLASAGLALIVGAAVVVLKERVRPSRAWLLTALLGVMLLQNVSHLWTRKHGLFLKRAEPTEQLIALARSVEGPIYVRCFPRPPIIAEAAVEVALGRPPGTLVWDEAEARRLRTAATFCYK